MQYNDTKWRFKKLTGKQLETSLKYFKINCLLTNTKKIPDEPDCTYILDNLWLGNFKSAFDYNFLTKNKIKKVINVTFDIPNVFKDSEIQYIQFEISEKHPCNKNLAYILNTGADTIHTELNKNNNVLVHCKRGHHRSASIIAFYLIKYHNMSVYDAIYYIKKYRPNSFRRMTCMVNYLILYESELAQSKR